MQLCLESLLLTSAELQSAQHEVRAMAYQKWQEAGRPNDDSLKFWREAELEWIEYHYVPDRYSSTEFETDLQP